MEWEQADGADESWSIFANKTIDYMRGLLTQARDKVRQVIEDHKGLPASEKRCGFFKAQVTDVTGLGGKRG